MGGNNPNEPIKFKRFRAGVDEIQMHRSGVGIWIEESPPK